jgi:hypothetical protein
VTAGKLTVGAWSVELESPTTKTVFDSFVSRAMMVVEDPDPIVTDEPGTSVCPEMTNWEAELADIAEEPMVITTTGFAVGVGAAETTFEDGTGPDVGFGPDEV